MQDVIAAVKARHGVYATRAAREFATQQGIDLAGVTGSGKHGLIHTQDVKRPSTVRTGAGGVGGGDQQPLPGECRCSISRPSMVAGRGR
ncbi:E3 binding domain-containing protein [Streptomyces sp. NPDC006670]|uniref:E3 binding domain-containing protein n=1 Tax=Streptomyces sp. NPDC006670 TaxID=3154476 RepID=UPI0034071EF7